MKPIFTVGALLLLIGCGTTYLSIPRRYSPLQLRAQAITEAHFTYSTDRTELIGRLKDSDGTLTQYKTIRRPLTGDTVQAETIVYRNDQQIEQHQTTPSESSFVLKVAANQGVVDIYKDLKERYRLAGLTL